MSDTASSSKPKYPQHPDDSHSGGLIPGYKHVEAFGPDEDYESDEDEEFYVVLDMTAVDQTLVPSSSTYRLIALDTPTPFLQLSGTIMKGYYQTKLGSDLIFKETLDDTDATSRAQNENVRFHSLTTRGIRFHEVELKPKSDESPEFNEEGELTGNGSRMQGKKGRGRGRSRKFVNQTSQLVEQRELAPIVPAQDEDSVSANVQPTDSAVAEEDLGMAMEVDG